MIILLSGDPFLAGEARRARRAAAGVPVGDVALVPAAEALADGLAGVSSRLSQGTLFGPPPWVETPDLYALLNGLKRSEAAAARERFRAMLEAAEGTWVVSAERAAGPGRRAFRRSRDVAAFVAEPGSLLGSSASTPDHEVLDLPLDRRGRPDAPAFARERLEREGLRPDPSLCKAVVDRVGPDPSAVAMAAATLALFVWPEATASPQEAARLPRGGAVTVWALLDLALDGRGGDAHALLHALRRTGEDPLRVLGWLVAEWRRLALALEQSDSAALATALGPRMAWKAKRVAGRSRRLGGGAIAAGFRALADSDSALKAGGGDPWSALSLLLYNLAPHGH